MPEHQPLGAVLDQLGVTACLDETDRLTEALVIAKATNMDTGQTALVLATSHALDWIAIWGLHTAAREAIQAAGEPHNAAEDE